VSEKFPPSKFFLKIAHARTQPHDLELQRQRCKIYNATGSLARFENKIFYSTLYLYIVLYCSLKNALVYYNACVVAVHSKVVGLAPVADPTIFSYNASAVKIYNAKSSLEPILRS
jgi:hypothetical protein